jgi:hypothetical protein
MAALVTEVLDPSQDGLGRATGLGFAFLRRVKVDLNASAAAYTLLASTLGAQRILHVLSVVPKSNDFVYVSAEASDQSSVTLTAASSAAVYEVYVLVQGI